MYEQVHCGDEAASHQLPIAAAFCIISFHGDMFKLNAKFDADLLPYLLILNVMATQYTCSLNGTYRLH